MGNSNTLELWNTFGTCIGAVASFAVVVCTAYALRRDARAAKRQRKKLSQFAVLATSKGVAAIRAAHDQLAGIHPDRVNAVVADRVGALQRAQNVINNIIEREFDYRELERLVAVATLIDEAKEVVRPLSRNAMVTLNFDQGYAVHLQRIVLAAEQA